MVTCFCVSFSHAGTSVQNACFRIRRQLVSMLQARYNSTNIMQCGGVWKITQNGRGRTDVRLKQIMLVADALLSNET